MTAADDEGNGPGWRVTPLTVYSGIAGGLLVAGGLVLGRPDVVVLGVPLILMVAGGLARVPQAAPQLSVDHVRHDPERNDVHADIRTGDAAGVAAVRLRVTTPGHRPDETLLDARENQPRRVSLTTVRTGRQRVFGVDYVGLSADGAFWTGQAEVAPTTITLLPRASRLHRVPLPFQLQGLTGSHHSRRPGEGGDLRDVAMFAPGDRMRRIDWRTTARRGMVGSTITDVYVRRTFATADAHVLLVVDPRDAVGPNVATWAAGRARPDEPTSLDIARNAATSFARHFLDSGDRVGLIDLGRNQRPLVPAGGKRHLHRVIHHLSVMEPHRDLRRGVRAPQIPSGALVVVCSTFLDDHPAELAQLWRHGGHRVLAIDVLPPVHPDGLTPRMDLARRIVLMERDDRLKRLAAADVEIVRWQASDGPAADESRLAALTALARSPRRHR